MTRHENKDVLKTLQDLPAFRECPKPDLQDLVKSSRETSLPANWPLIHQETPADACYVLLSGTAEVRVGTAVVATVGAGDVVGEMALAGGRLRNATVTSTSPLSLLHINAEAFHALLERRPALASALLPRAKAVVAAAED